MSRAKVLLLAAGAALALHDLPASPGRAQNPATSVRPVPDEARFGRELHRFVEALRADPGAPPGIAVVVVHRGRTVFERAYGTRDNRTNAPLTLDTPMYNASVTKAYTGLLAAVLDADGVLPLSASLREVWGISLPAPLDAGAVTAERLLSHTAGLHAGGLTFRSVITGQIEAREVPRHLALYARPYPGGDGFVYQNWNPFIWSAMAEARTGTPWRELLRQRVLRPLGLRRSSTRLEDFGADGVAICHARAGGGWRAQPPRGTATLNAAGGMYTSPRDAAAFLNVMITDGRSAGGAIPAAVLRRTWRRASVQDRAMWGLHRDGYGLGWDLGTIGGHRFVARSGGNPGCRAISMFLPEQGLGIVVMSNGGVGANSHQAAIFGQTIDLWTGAPEAVARGAARLRETHAAVGQAIREADAGDPRLARVTPIDAAAWRDATGAYRNDRLGDASIGVSGGELRLSIGVFSEPLLSLSGDQFLLEEPEDRPTSFSFIRDGRGQIVAFMLDDDRFERVPG